jgi:SAM-dependent methyltransferase
MSPDARTYAPAVARNREPILAVLKPELPLRGVVLEIASGSGEHIVHIAAASCANLLFQPSDPDADALASIDAWAQLSGLANLRPALALDAAAVTWPVSHANAVLCINMIHIAPWAATAGLMRGAASILPPGGLLYLYGPYRQSGQLMAPSNVDFDRSLHDRNPAWGLRDLDDVVDVAMSQGFAAPRIEPMPANNLSLFFRRMP